MAEDRAHLVDRFIGMARGRVPAIFAIEVANESWENGFEGREGAEEVRALGSRLRGGFPGLVALSSPPNGLAAMCDLYGDSAANFLTRHYERDTRADVWAPVWQPWLFHAEAARCGRRLPEAVSSNEPIGPQSSVNADDSALRVALSYATSFVAGHAAYVFHAGPGVRGGGREDLAMGRPASFEQLPNAAELARALRSTKAALPAGLANWPRQDAARNPAFDGLAEAEARHLLARAYSGFKNGEFIVVLLGLRNEVTVRARHALTYAMIDPLTGASLGEGRAAAGSQVTIVSRRQPQGDGVIVRGRIEAD
jgi:hypothetical protein